MMTANSDSVPKISFQELKAKVGIDDVAHALGYRIDRKAGVGRFFEMVLGSGTSKKDTLIIRNTSNKAAQTFFRRDGAKGDVITLIRENLNAFIADGKTEWQKITNILSNFANMPVQEFRSDLEYINSNRGAKPFNPERYDVADIDLSNIHKLFGQRGFNSNTVKAFSPYVKLISDRQNRNFNGFNIGFPYTSICQDEVVGYEIRGFGGFKSKASGTNSSSAAWIADFTNGNSLMVKNVFFFESAFDAMAFWQINSVKLNNDFALVSIGGTFSDNQILSVIDRFPNARLNDCFDNDIAGRINGLRLLSVAEGLHLKIKNKSDDEICLSIKEQNFSINPKKNLYAQISEHLSLRHKLSQRTPPDGFKDWNDCLLGRRQSNQVSAVDKHTRNEHLAQKRNSIKL